MPVESFITCGNSIKSNVKATSSIGETALLASKTAIFGSKSCHMIFGNDTQFVIEVYAVGLLVDSAFRQYAPTIMPSREAGATSQQQFCNDASHTWITVTILVLSTNGHLASQQDSPQLGAITTREGISLSVGISAQGIGHHIGSQQFVVGGRVPADALLLASSVRGRAPYCRTWIHAQITVNCQRPKHMSLTFLLDKGF